MLFGLSNRKEKVANNTFLKIDVIYKLTWLLLILIKLRVEVENNLGLVLLATATMKTVDIYVFRSGQNLSRKGAKV